LFSSTATNFVAGIPTDNRTFPVTDPVAVALGAKPLRPEKSKNASVGVVFYPGGGLSVTADYYKITIRDRIVLSGTFNQPAVVQFLQDNGFQGVGGARFFTNAVATRTEGEDIVAGYAFNLFKNAPLRLTATYNHTRNEVTRVDSTPGVLAGFKETLFDRVERARVEVGQPRNNFNFTGILSYRAWTFNGHLQRYGEVTSFGTPVDGSLDQTFSPKWITDASVAYDYRQNLTLMIGADNIFNVYPDRNSVGSPTVGGNSNFGIFPYNGISPFGFNGRFAYVRATWNY
jgi:iron complex outermembrane receptor protein